MSSISSNSSTGKSGNTKQISPAKNWCFTLNNYTKDDIEYIIGVDSSIVPRYVFQEEVGTSGTRHLQGFVSFSSKKRPKSVFTKINPHWEVCRNVKASIAYCMKQDTQNGQLFTRGVERPFKLDIELYDWQKDIRDIVIKEPDDRTIYWFWEANGCRGKTTFAKWLYINFPKVVVLSGKGADMKNGIIQYQEKNNSLPNIVIINVPRSSQDFISYTGIEEIKDMFFFSGKYEGGMVCGKNPHVLVFANEPPRYDKMSEDRWSVTNL